MSWRDHRPATLHSVFERTFHEERRALTGWVAGLVALAITMLALYPTIRGNTQFSKLFESYPEAFRSISACPTTPAAPATSARRSSRSWDRCCSACSRSSGVPT